MSQNAKVITCGCRFNRYESAEIQARLEDGTATAPRPVVVINTCAVTAKSEAKSKYAIRKAVHENPGAAIVVAGCLAELAPESVKAIDGVHLVLGNEEKLSASALLEGKGAVHTGAVHAATAFTHTGSALMENRTAAYLKIQNGCDETCSFCVVRLVRGKSRSATPEYVLQDVDRLIAQGVREIVLTGINIGRYGADMGNGFAGLLREIVRRRGARFRLSSINPADITPEVADLIADSPNLCKHLHIPLQSGSDAVLSKMRRPYTADQYRETVEEIAEKIPGIAIGADVMAGFPGETKRDFEDTARLLETLPFSYAHVFSYSRRPRTDAGDMPGALASAIIKERAETLKEIAARKNLAFRQSLVGSTVEVLVEQHATAAGFLRGKTGTFITVEFSGKPAMKGGLVNVLISGVTECGTTGTAA